MLSRIAWVAAAATLLLVVTDAIVSAQAVELTSETAVAVHGFPFVHGAVLGSSVMGALIVSRYERHPIGWLLALVGLASAVSLLTEAYAYWVQDADGPGSSDLGGVAAWISTLVGGQLAIAGLALMFLLAPDGSFLSRRWRYAAWVTAAGAALCVTAVLSMDPASFRLQTTSEVFDPVRSAMVSIGFVAISGGLVASVVSMLRRLRRSTGEQRQQVALIALAAALIAAGLVCLFVVQALNGGEQTWLAGLPLFVAYFLLPILFAVAVLRHRLYDVELIIDRTVVLVAGTAFAAIGYTTLVVLVAEVVDEQTGGFWLSMLATAVVALAFQPLRRRVARFADKMAYGSRAQPYQELADFSRRLGETPTAGSLLPTVAAAAGQAVDARRATAMLDVPGAGAVPAVWGASTVDGDVHTVTVCAGGVDLGRITVALRTGRHLRPVDARLLRVLADQAAVAFRNVAMEAQLADHVAELDRTTTELARSRARIIEADDAVRRDLEDAISRQVLPHLLVVAEGLDRIRVADDVPPAAVERLAAEVSTALEALRELTRGVYPTQLARSGLGPALRSLLARSVAAPALVLDPALDGQRFAARVEAALYFCCTRAVPWATSIELALDGPDLSLTVRGVDATSIEPQVVDRVEAADGTLRVVGHGVSVRFPVAASQASTSRPGPNVAFAT